MINPGTLPVDGAREDVAAANLAVFLTAVHARAAELDEVPIRHRVAALVGEPERNTAADRDGRFGWNLRYSDSRTVRLLMPGTELDQIRALAAACRARSGVPAACSMPFRAE